MAATNAKHPGGRPTVVTAEVLRKLEEAFAYGATDTEACFYADIGTTALYKHQEKHPQFAERKALLKERPILLARQTVVDNLTNDPHLAFKFLEKKRPDEFRSRQEISGPDGRTLTLINMTPHDDNGGT